MKKIESYQKLSDRFKNLELSHSCKCELLNKCEALLCAIESKLEMTLEDKAYIKEFRRKIDCELRCCGRVYYFKNQDN